MLGRSPTFLSFELIVHVRLALWYKWPVLGSVVDTHVLVLAILGQFLDLLLLLLFDEEFGQVAVTHDSFNFLIVFVLFLQFFRVGELFLLPRQEWLDRFCSLAFPDPDARILGARH